MSAMRRWIRFCTLFTLQGTLLLGCSRDPNVRKQKYLERGERYFQAGKIREAAIEFANALQVDPNFADAHYQLARCDLRESSWSGAYQELVRTTDLQPQNADALIDLA